MQSKELQTTKKELSGIVLTSGKQVRVKFPEVKTVHDSILCPDNPTLKSLTQQLSGGEKRLKAIIKMMFITLNRILNLKTSLTAEAIDEIADEIYSQYPYFRLSDLYLITWRIKTGKCGELYESLNIAKVLKWVDDYALERADECGEMSRCDSDRYKKDDYVRYSDCNPVKEFLERTKR